MARFSLFILAFLNLGLNLTLAQSDSTFDQLHKKLTLEPVASYQEVIEFHQEARESNDPFRKGKGNFLLGEYYYALGDALQASTHYKAALNHFEEINNREYMAYTYSAIGALFLVIKDFDQSIAYQNKALEIHQARNDSVQQGHALFNMANIMTHKEDFDSALFYFRWSEEVYSACDYTVVLGRNYLMTSYIHLLSGNFEQALSDGNAALRYAIMDGDKMAEQSVHFTLGSIFLANEEVDSAKDHFNLALALTSAVGNKDIEADILKELSAVYEQQDSIEISNAYLKRSVAIKDSLFSLQEIHEIEDMHGLDLTQNETIVTKESSTSWWWIIGSIILIVVAFSIVFWRRKNSNHKQHQLESELDLKKKELISKTIQVNQQTALIEDIKSQLKLINQDNFDNGELRRMLSSLKSSSAQNGWAEFEVLFNEIHIDFYKKLNDDYPKLTPNERKLSAFICLNLSNKEIAQITHKTVRSIEVARYRMRKKMELKKEDSLVSVLTSFT